MPYERVVDVAGKYDPDVWSQRHFAQESLRAVQPERRPCGWRYRRMMHGEHRWTTVELGKAIEKVLAVDGASGPIGSACVYSDNPPVSALDNRSGEISADLGGIIVVSGNGQHGRPEAAQGA
jgi:hypothetical protein